MAERLTVDTVTTSREEVPAGQFVTLSAVVSSSAANRPWTGTLEMYDLDDELLATSEVTVRPGQSKLVEIPVQVSKTGDRVICTEIVNQSAGA